MLNDQAHQIFWQLGRHTRTGAPLPAPFSEAGAVARLIYDDLTQVGLSSHAIRRVACALLSVSVSAKQRCCDGFFGCERGAK